MQRKQLRKIEAIAVFPTFSPLFRLLLVGWKRSR